jgi:hypothetical protein
VASDGIARGGACQPILRRLIPHSLDDRFLRAGFRLPPRLADTADQVQAKRRGATAAETEVSQGFGQRHGAQGRRRNTA